MLKRSTLHTFIATFLAVAVVLTLTAPVAVAVSLAECVDTVAMNMDQCETTPAPCCCEAHSTGAADQMMGTASHSADHSTPDSMPVCGCSLSSSEPAPVVPVAVPAHGTSSVVIAAHSACSTNVIAPAHMHELAMERGPAPSHEGIYLTHCALLR